MPCYEIVILSQIDYNNFMKLFNDVEFVRYCMQFSVTQHPNSPKK